MNDVDRCRRCGGPMYRGIFTFECLERCDRRNAPRAATAHPFVGLGSLELAVDNWRAELELELGEALEGELWLRLSAHPAVGLGWLQVSAGLGVCWYVQARPAAGALRMDGAPPGLTPGDVARVRVEWRPLAPHPSRRVGVIVAAALEVRPFS
jgi:hypothetical protein